MLAAGVLRALILILSLRLYMTCKQLTSLLYLVFSLGFIFGVGTGVCVRKVNKNAAYAVGGALVAVQVRPMPKHNLICGHNYF